MAQLVKRSSNDTAHEPDVADAAALIKPCIIGKGLTSGANGSELQAVSLKPTLLTSNMPKGRPQQHKVRVRKVAIIEHHGDLSSQHNSVNSNSAATNDQASEPATATGQQLMSKHRKRSRSASPGHVLDTDAHGNVQAQLPLGLRRSNSHSSKQKQPKTAGTQQQQQQQQAQGSQLKQVTDSMFLPPGVTEHANTMHITNNGVHGMEMSETMQTAKGFMPHQPWQERQQQADMAPSGIVRDNRNAAGPYKQVANPLAWRSQSWEHSDGVNAPQEASGKQRKRPGRPPKAAAQPPGSNRLSTSADGHLISIDEPYHSNAVQQHGLEHLGNGTSSGTAAAAAAAPNGCSGPRGYMEQAGIMAGTKRRLSMRSVAYLEDLLQETAEGAATTGDKAARPKLPQLTSGANRGQQPLTGRLSVGSLIISPPMSRAASMSVQPGGGSGTALMSPPRSIKPARTSDQELKDRQISGSATDEQKQPATAEAAVASSATGSKAPTVTPQAGSGELAAPKQQHTATAAASVQHPGRNQRQAAPAGTNALPGNGLAPLESAQFNRAAAAAVAAWQRAVAATNGVDDSDSSSGEESDSPNAGVWRAAAAAGGLRVAAGAGNHGQSAAEQACCRCPVSCCSDTSTSPSSSGSPVFEACLMGAFAGVQGAATGMQMPQGLLYGGMMPGWGGAPAVMVPRLGMAVSHAFGQDGLPAQPMRTPRKSDRQLGMETVQRVNALLQQNGGQLTGQLGSLFGGATLAATAADSITAGGGRVPAAASPLQGATGTGATRATGSQTGCAINGAAGQTADEQCTVAALDKGLRFDGDITLREVAMAFQLRDAYDWDEDLEAAAKEAKDVEDPRLKGPKLLPRSPSVSDNSVCPDPEPVSGFQPRSMWMSGNGGEASSPIPGLLAQKGTRQSQQSCSGYARLLQRGSIPPAVRRRLQKQSIEGVGSQPGSITSSRRASIGASPVDATDSRIGTGERYMPPAPAELQAALAAEAQKQQGLGRGWTALMPGVYHSDADAEKLPWQQQADGNAAAAAPEAAAAAGLGAQGSTTQTPLKQATLSKRRRRTADESDDDYDPRKPSHQQECYQRKQHERRSAQQQYYNMQQARMYQKWCQSGMPGYHAAAMQQAYMMAQRSGMSMQHWQQHMQRMHHMHQIHHLQQHHMMQQLEKNNAAGDGMIAPVKQEDDATAGGAGGSPFSAAAQQQDGHHADRHQQQQLSRQQTLQNPTHQQQEPSMLALSAQQQVRQRPSYVKRRLVADEAAGWLQAHSFSGLKLQLSRSLQPGVSLDAASEGAAGAIAGCAADNGINQQPAMQIMSPTGPAHGAATVMEPRTLLTTAAGCAGSSQPPNPAAAQQASRSASIIRAKRICKRSSRLLDDALTSGGESGAVSGSSNTEGDDDIESDCSDAEVGYSVGRGRGRGRTRGRGGRGRGPGRGRGVLGNQCTVAAAAATASAAQQQSRTAAVGGCATGVWQQLQQQLQPAAASAGSEVTAAANAGTPMVPSPARSRGGARGRGNSGGRGRGRARGRSNLGIGAAANLPAAAATLQAAAGVQLVTSSAKPPVPKGSSSTSGRGRGGRGRGRGGRAGRATGAASAQNGAAPGFYPQHSAGVPSAYSHSRPGSAGMPAAADGPTAAQCLAAMPPWFAAGLAQGVPGVNGAAGQGSVPPPISNDVQQMAGQQQQRLNMLSSGSMRSGRQSCSLLGNTVQPEAGTTGSSAGDPFSQQQAGTSSSSRLQSLSRDGWVTQVADGGVLVQVPDGGPLQAGEDQQLMQDLSEPMVGLLMAEAPKLA